MTNRRTEQHDDSDMDVDFDGERTEHEEILKDEHDEDKINDAIKSPTEEEHGQEDLLEPLQPGRDILESPSKEDADDMNTLDEHIPDLVDVSKEVAPQVVDAVKEVSEADDVEAIDGDADVSDVENEVDVVNISEENEDRTWSTESEIVIEKMEEAPEDARPIEDDSIPVIETFDETLFRKLSEHVEAESLAKVDKPLTRSYGLLSFPEICIQAASPMAQSPEEETQEFEENEIEQVDEEIQKGSEIVCEDRDNIFVDQVKETILTEESESIGGGMLGRSICAEIILGSEIPVSEQADGEVKDMIDFSDDDLENEKLSEIHKSEKIVPEDYEGENIVAETDLPPSTDHHDVPVENSLVESSADDLSQPSAIAKPDVLLDLCTTESEETEQTGVTEDEAYYDKIASEKVREIMMESCRMYTSEEVLSKYDSIPTVRIEQVQDDAEVSDHEEVDLKLDQVEPDLESKVPDVERIPESHGNTTDEVQKSEADLIVDDDDEELEMKARMLAKNILEDLREVVTCWDDGNRSVEQSKDEQFGFQTAEWEVSNENLKMECLGGAPSSGPTHVLESPLSDFAAPDQTAFDQLSSFDRQRFVIPVDSSSLMATSTSSANSDLTGILFNGFLLSMSAWQCLSPSYFHYNHSVLQVSLSFWCFVFINGYSNIWFSDLNCN